MASPRIIAIAAGKGGVGKSTVALHLALAIGRAGRRVTLVDADFGAANLHTMVGMLHPPHGLADFFDGRMDLDDITTTIAPLVGLIPGSSRPGSADISAAERQSLMDAIRTLDADCVIVDIGAGTGEAVLDLLAAADHKLLVMLPELTSLHNAYALIKASVHRAIRALSADELHQSLIDSALGGESRSRSVSQLIQVVRPLEPGFTNVIQNVLSGFGLGIIANQVESDNETKAIGKVTQLIRDQLQISAPMLGAIRHASALAGSLRGGLNANASTDPSRFAFAAIARALLETDLFQLRARTRSRDLQPMAALG